ncbi:hypothetical protein QBC42DRAFT_226491 [Cladorrhinum samala]|uniref:Uncharacterized protein n=1 Tax=Cladorrhinum samala TaxID=585594 RepID=A0AAV9HNC6_9PEZI|nr:hypothetical protein QBC42DRAFT_226491 [Cladorrhinum samala]
MRRHLVPAAVLALGVATVNAASVVYVTDLKIFSQLAPCAASALKYNIQSLTNRECPEPVTELQSCVCTKNNNLASIASRVSSSVSYSCGGTASEDQASASTVLSAYCNQATPAAFPTPTAVSAYITDFPEVDILAPCAQSALKYAVGTMTYDRCPTEPAALASCACLKNQNSLAVSQIINTSAKYSCSGHTADISSAQAMFAAYCQLNSGTSNFPQATKPPGDMSYYITDLPQYSSLAPCAASAIKYVIQAQTYAMCPDGPQALASCVCLKDGMTADVLKSLTSSVKYSCSSTATEDVSSALAVWDVYCSAAAGKFTAAGVTASVEQTYPKGVSGVPKATGVSNGSGNGSSASGSSGSSSSSSGGNSDPNDTGKSSTNVPVIAGAIGGVIVAIILIGAAIFFVRRSANKRRDMEKLPNASGGPGLGGTEIQNNATPAGFYSPNGGKAELATDTVLAPPPPASPSPSTLKVNSPERTDNVSPVSAHHTGGSAFAPPHNNQASLYPPMPQNSSELPSPATTGYPSPPPGQPNAPELYGQGVMHAHSPQRPELAGQGTQFNNPSLNRPELQGQGAMYAPAPDRPELAGQGTQFHHANPNRPELMGQGAMYAPAPDRPELAGQGSHFHNANLNRPELQGQNMMFAPPPPNGTQELQGQGPGPASPYQQHQQQPYQQQQAGYQQQQAGYPQPPRSPYQQQQPPIEMQQMSWQSGPTPGLYEMDGARSTGQGDAGAPGVAR